MRKPEEELADIKSMMEQSTRFLSLSGISGILAGIYALIASALAYYWIYFPEFPIGNQIYEVYQNGKITHLMLMGLLLLSLTIVTSWAFSRQKSNRNAYPIWTPASKRFVQALAIPVISGGMFCIALIHEGQLILAFPAMLLFYGTGLLNASSFTLNNLKYLGYGQLILGVIAGFVPEWGFVLWTLGFGVFHVIYGSLIYSRYER